MTELERSTDPKPPTELELKLLLPGVQAYEALRAGLGPPSKEREQINVFFDSSDHVLSKAGWALRVRRSGNERVVVTVKGRARSVAGAKHRVEWEEDVAPGSWSQVEAGAFPVEARSGGPWRSLCEQVGDVGPLQVLVRFGNHRMSYQRELGGRERTLELDRTEFPGEQVEFEVEVEVDADASDPAAEVQRVAADLADLLAAHGIEARTGSESKFARALRAAGVEVS